MSPRHQLPTSETVVVRSINSSLHTFEPIQSQDLASRNVLSATEFYNLAATPEPPPNSPTSAWTTPSHSGQRLAEADTLGTPLGSELSDDDLMDMDYFKFVTSNSTPPANSRPKTSSTLQSGKPLIGLGISGLSSNDSAATGTLTGIGLLSLKPSNWPTDNQSYSHRDESSQTSPSTPSFCVSTLSDTFRHEAACTFIEDPCHHHALEPIPECDSLDEIEKVSAPKSQDCQWPLMRSNGHHALPNGNFKKQSDSTSPTVSSLLRRSLTAGAEAKRVPRASGSRPRAASEPRPPWKA